MFQVLCSRDIILLFFLLLLFFQVCCSGDILAALPEPTAEPVVEEPVKIQCPSYRFAIDHLIICLGIVRMLLIILIVKIQCPSYRFAISLQLGESFARRLTMVIIIGRMKMFEEIFLKKPNGELMFDEKYFQQMWGGG